MPPAGALRLKREESAPAVDGMRVAAEPVPVPVVEGEVLLETETAVLKGLVEVKEVTTVDLPLTDEALTVEALTVEDAVLVEVAAAAIENEPVEA
jgi:hypothetical protein